MLMEKKNQKSRNGCITCKKKRLKCDESKPQCQNCLKKRIECGGYSTTFKWKSFEETTTSRVKKKQNMKPRSSSLPGDKQFEDALQQASISIAGRSPNELARQSELMRQGLNPHSKLSVIEELHSHRSPVEFTTSSVRQSTHDCNSNHGQHSSLAPFRLRRMSATIVTSPQVQPFSPALSPTGGAPSPTLSTIVRSFTDFDNMVNSPPNFDSMYPKLYEVDSDAVDDTPDVPSHTLKRSLSVDTALATTSIPQYRRELLSYSQSLSPKVAHTPQYDLSNVAFSTDFDRVFQAFDKYTCAIMSIKDGPTENPWRTLMWPLAMEHTVLFKSLASMALFHVARGDDAIRKAGLNYMRQSMSELAEGLVNNSIPNDVALATCLTLAITDTWDKNTTAGIAHLKGAKSIINKLNAETIKTNAKLYKFLINSFLYYDVLARMSSSMLDSDYDENGKPVRNLAMLRPDTSENSSDFNPLSPFFDESIISDSDYVIDPLLGCARGLFLVIGRVASFISKVRNMKKLSLSTVSMAVTLKTEIESWRPDANVKRTILEDPLCDLSSCIATAEAYRFSALLYLEQAVPEISSSSSADLGDKVLMLLASIPTSSKTCLLHMFPLLVASCEASDPEDREWIENRWKVLQQTIWIGTIEKTVEIIHEVWRRKDALKNAHSDDPKDWDLFQGRIDVLSGSKKRETEGINSRTHWSSVMKDWNWQVLFG